MTLLNPANVPIRDQPLDGGGVPSDSTRMRKLSAIIADGIVELIAETGWPVGAVIATESELKERFGASRAVVREALGLVELRGVAAMKAGKGGGLMVTAPARDATVMALAIYLELADLPLEDVIEMMQRLEALSLQLTIDRMSDASAATLQHFAAEMAKPPRDADTEMAVFRAYRNALAQASGNPVLALFVAAFQIALAGLSMSRFYDPEQIERHIRASKSIKHAVIEAVLACEPHAALVALRTDYGNQLRSVRASEIGTMSRIKEDAERHGMKLPRWIALQISRRIADHALEPGDPLGSEGELIAQFGVGRPVLREAIRMLEAYSVVIMHRGQGGGLRVALPDPEPTFRSVLPFLLGLPESAAHAFEVRAALEVDAAGLAAERRDETTIAMLRAELAEAGRRAGGDPDKELVELGNISGAIVRASGDKVLDFMAAITQRMPPKTWDAALASAAFHRCGPIVDAIAAGDRSRARRLMHGHLRGLRQLYGDFTRTTSFPLFSPA